MEVSINDFPDWKKHMDILVKLFSIKGWRFDEVRPEITFSDELVLLAENKNGLHGSGISRSKDYDRPYLLSDYKKTDSGFVIIIYTKVLKSTAKDLENFDRFLHKDGVLVDRRNLLHYIENNGSTPDYGMDYEEAQENLFYCALVNETAKWILADVVDVNGNTWKESPLEKKDHLHECLSASCAYWVVSSNNSTDLTKTFNWVFNTLHIGNYSMYNDFTREQNESVIEGIEIARFENIEKLEIFKHFCEKNINFVNYKDSIHKGKLFKNKYGL